MKSTPLISAYVLAWLFATGLPAADDVVPPQLRKRGEATQLIVAGKPFVMLAGELHNSSASGVEYMQQLWPHLKALGLNTVLAPVSWELLEPAEGQFER